jgi:hypothetical protein
MVAPGYQVQRRVPATYDPASRTVDCIAATENPHHCQFGLSVFRIRRKAVDLDLIDCAHPPLLDAHDHDRVLGSVIDAWIDDRQLYATLRFDKTPAAIRAEVMVRDGEITSVSVGATIKRWIDEDGEDILDTSHLNPHFNTWGRDDGPQTFTATRWVLNEISLATHPADKMAVIL